MPSLPALMVASKACRQLMVKYFSGISTSALPMKWPGLPMI